MTSNLSQDKILFKRYQFFVHSFIKAYSGCFTCVTFYLIIENSKENIQ